MSNTLTNIINNQPPPARVETWLESESRPGHCRWCKQAAQIRDCYCGLFTAHMVNDICRPCYRKIDAMLTPRVVQFPITLEVIA